MTATEPAEMYIAPAECWAALILLSESLTIGAGGYSFSDVP